MQRTRPRGLEALNGWKYECSVLPHESATKMKEEFPYLCLGEILLCSGYDFIIYY